MAHIIPLENKEPDIHESVWLAPTATVIGESTIGRDSTVWFNAVVRGDVNAITIGEKVNIQDGAVIHCTYKKAATRIGNNVSIGHNAIVHGCAVEDNVLIGMGAIVMDQAVIKSHSIIAAGAVVLQNTVVEEYSIYAGVPAKKVKTLSAEEAEKMIGGTADNYVEYASWFKAKE